jgi:septal ring factor EnvC (AmiA/AmiB activator)
MAADPEETFVALADELYGLAPAAFTDARNEYVKELKTAGDRETSERVKALKKPAAAAWVVNMLVRHQAEEMTQVLDLGASLRAAQADLDGDALRELAKQRRRLVAAVAGKGRTLARDLGQKVSESVLRQVEDTLHAAMVDTDAEAAVRSGMLVDPLSPSGVGSLKVASAVADHTALGRSARPLSEVTASAGKRPGLSVVPEPDPAAREREERREARTAAKQALRAAEADLAVARKELKQREKQVSDLQAATLQVNGEIDELRRALDALETRLERLDEQGEAAREERDESLEAVDLAAAAVADAQAEIDRLTD